MLSAEVLCYGSDEPLPERTTLSAGPLSLVFEQGDLRYIKLGANEILRRVYIAVRDRNWRTVSPVISNLRMQVASDSFHITYDAHALQGDIDFFWKGTISGDPSGTIRLAMDGVARSTFLRNRIGFCILHPMGCAGNECRIEHVDGSVESSDFPVHIAPQAKVDGKVQPVQPFAEMQALSHQVLPGLWAEVRFEGDIFETEDQRNWTDASYKTYGTPLRLPFPAEVKQGTKTAQVVTLSLHGELPQIGPKQQEGALTLVLDDHPSGPLPRIGLGVASHGETLSSTELERLRLLNLSHLRVDLDLSNPMHETALRRATAEARALGAELEIALVLSDAASEELEALSVLLQQVKPAVWSWLIFHHAQKSTGAKWVAVAREVLTRYDAEAKIASGTNAFFASLNRGRPPVEVVDLVTYSLNPQVHASDNASLVETLQAQADTVESARQFSGGRPVMVSPITLKMRFNPNATGAEPMPGPGELPSPVDVRQMSLLGAGWTAGSLKYLSESGVYSATYYETSGWRGVMETKRGSPLPERFLSLPGSVFPLYHVLADVLEFAGGEVVRTTALDTLRVDGLAVCKDGKMRVLIANMTGESQDVTVVGVNGPVWVRHLNTITAEEAMLSPEVFRTRRGDRKEASEGQLSLCLLPWAVARLDFDSTGESQ